MDLRAWSACSTSATGWTAQSATVSASRSRPPSGALAALERYGLVERGRSDGFRAAPLAVERGAAGSTRRSSCWRASRCAGRRRSARRLAGALDGQRELPRGGGRPGGRDRRRRRLPPRAHGRLRQRRTCWRRSSRSSAPCSATSASTCATRSASSAPSPSTTRSSRRSSAGTTPRRRSASARTSAGAARPERGRRASRRSRQECHHPGDDERTGPELIGVDPGPPQERQAELLVDEQGDTAITASIAPTWTVMARAASPTSIVRDGGVVVRGRSGLARLRPLPCRAAGERPSDRRRGRST